MVPGAVHAFQGSPGTGVPLQNDLCLAGMSSFAVAAQMVQAGEIPAAVVGGFESMSRAPRVVGPGLAPGPDSGEPVDLEQYRVRRQPRVGGLIGEYRLVVRRG